MNMYQTFIRTLAKAHIWGGVEQDEIDLKIATSEFLKVDKIAEFLLSQERLILLPTYMTKDPEPQTAYQLLFGIGLHIIEEDVKLLIEEERMAYEDFMNGPSEEVLDIARDLGWDTVEPFMLFWIR